MYNNEEIINKLDLVVSKLKEKQALMEVENRALAYSYQLYLKFSKTADMVEQAIKRKYLNSIPLLKEYIELQSDIDFWEQQKNVFTNDLEVSSKKM